MLINKYFQSETIYLSVKSLVVELGGQKQTVQVYRSLNNCQIFVRWAWQCDQFETWGMRDDMLSHRE